jgi:hypothetical protein
MPLLRVEAEKMSSNQLVAGLIEEIITVNEFFSLLPFAQVNGKAYVYHRENTLPTVSFLDPNDTVTEDAGTFTEIVSKLRILAGDVDVDNFLNETMSDTDSQLALQLALKTKAMARQFQDTSVNGDSVANTKSFDGMRVLTPAGQTTAAAVNGGALTLTMLDQLIDMVPNKPDFIMMRSGTRRAFVSLIRAASGNTGALLQHPNFDVPVLAHNGVPIIINDFLPANEVQGTSGAVCTSIYAARCNEMDGLHGLYGGDSAGFRVESIGAVQNKDAVRTRVKWYCGMALKSTKSIARLSGVTNV